MEEYNLEIDSTVVFEKTLQAIEELIRNPKYGEEKEPEFIRRYRFIVEQGGARSSKTYSIAQIIIHLCITKWQNYTITIARKTLPSLRFTAMKDFFDILRSLNIYHDKYHNRSDNIYRIKTNEISFVSVDDPQKFRGRKHDVVWLNEANELTYEDFRQVNMRMNDLMFLDYNPSEEDHWIYNKILTRANTKYIKSTYRDNPFLPQSIVDEIELYKKEDIHYWTIYGLGERATSPTKIYHNYTIVDRSRFPEPDEIIYGLDFNFTPQSLLEIRIRGGHYYLTQMMYDKQKITKDIIKYMNENIPNKKREIYADSAEPDRIEEIKRADFNIFKAIKDVTAGIMFVKGLKLFINSESIDLQNEIRKYSWKVDANGKILDEPVKVDDHLMACMRYALYTHYKRGYIQAPVTPEDIKQMETEYKKEREYGL